MKKLLLLSAAALMIQAVPAFAEPHGGDKDHRGGKFEKHDTNGDGVITEAEFLEHAKAKFAEKDLNKDGSLSKEEAKEAKDSMKKKWKEKRGDMRDKKSAE